MIDGLFDKRSYVCPHMAVSSRSYCCLCAGHPVSGFAYLTSFNVSEHILSQGVPGSTGRCSLHVSNLGSVSI